MKQHFHVSGYDVTGILKTLEEDSSYMEMTERDLSFLCAMLQNKKPNKVVEIGVAAGFTTNVIQTCLDELGCECNMYSVDYSKNYYRDVSKETGFLNDTVPERINYKRYLGGVVSEFIDDICFDGTKIDFIIIDTTHSLPGEIIDFIVCLPYLAENCIVVLHDVGLNHLKNGLPYQYATRLLFDVVSGDKYFDDNITGETDNIAAIRITKDTYDSIVDVFSSLSISWQYMLDEADLDSYVACIKKHYDDYFYNMFCKIVDIQKKSFSVDFARSFFKKEYDSLYNEWINSDNIIIYGCGYYGQNVISFARMNKLQIRAIMLSDDQAIPEIGEYKGIPIYHISDINNKYENISVIMGIGDKYKELCLKNLKHLKIKYNIIS